MIEFNKNRNTYISAQINQIEASEAIAFVDSLELSADEYLLMDRFDVYHSDNQDRMTIKYADSAICPNRDVVLPYSKTTMEANHTINKIIAVLKLSHEHSEQCLYNLMEDHDEQ